MTTKSLYSAFDPLLHRHYRKVFTKQT